MKVTWFDVCLSEQQVEKVKAVGITEHFTNHILGGQCFVRALHRGDDKEVIPELHFPSLGANVRGLIPLLLNLLNARQGSQEESQHHINAQDTQPGHYQTE